MINQESTVNSAKNLRMRVLAMSMVSTAMLVLVGVPAVFGYKSLVPAAMPFLLGLFTIWMGYYHVHIFQREHGTRGERHVDV